MKPDSGDFTFKEIADEIGVELGYRTQVWGRSVQGFTDKRKKRYRMMSQARSIMKELSEKFDDRQRSVFDELD